MNASPDIFLSYNREDQAVAARYADAFAAEGLNVWWDTALRSGEAYDEVTEAALRGAKAVVVLWSPRSVVSRWVRAEATIADRCKTLVPVTIEPCERPIMFELTQTADLAHWTGDAGERAWLAFLGDVRRFLGREVQPESAAPAPEAQIAPQPLAAKPSLVVRPFATMAGAGEADYFADGMVVEIVSALSRFSSLFVISSGSSLNLRGDVRSSGEIARELGVRYVLQGSVRKGGNAVRIAVELLDGDAHTPIWTQRFDGVLDDIFALQDEVANAVAARIDSTVRTNEMQQASARLTKDQGAYDLFLRGSHNMWASYEEAELREAISLFDQAIALDPLFALAMVLSSNACCNLQLFHFCADQTELMAKCLSLAKRAVEIDKSDYRVLAWASYSLLQCGQPIAAVNTLIERALEMNPGDSVTHWLSGWNNVFAPDPVKALSAFEVGLRLDPHSPWRAAFHAGQATALMQLDRFEEVIPLARYAADEYAAVRSVCQTMQAAALGYLGRLDEARTLDSVSYPLLTFDEAFFDNVRDGSLKPKILEGLRLAGIAPTPA
ncbi:MAG: TIR domain-containing protein [Novosphingobium sp.]|nr:TIR domain-containing protein [Novosphingobium sp.]